VQRFLNNYTKSLVCLLDCTGQKGILRDWSSYFANAALDVKI
jgi:hypothetical protein